MLHNNALRKIGTISRIVASRSDVKFKQYDLQKGQHIFVVRICENPGLNLKELTEMLNVDKSTTTKAVQKLERAGYVIKSHMKDNRKNIVLFPTEKAEIVYEKIIKEENIRADLCFDGFSETEKDQALQYLERICKNIETYK